MTSHHDAPARASSHRHASLRKKERLHPYCSPIRDVRKGGFDERAHGGVERVQQCRCGAIRRMNTNQGHWERGAWHLPYGKLPAASLRRLGAATFEYREWAEREARERALDFPDAEVETVLDAAGWVVRLQPGKDIYSGGEGVIVSIEASGRDR